MPDSRKTFNFDLDEKKLKVHYPSTSTSSYKRAWSDIRSFLEDNGFKHAQYSGYESIRGMSYYKAYSIFERLQEKFPWFKNCATVATLAELGEQYDVLEHLSKTIEATAFTLEEQQFHSLQDEVASAKLASQVLEEDKSHEPLDRDRGDIGR